MGQVSDFPEMCDIIVVDVAITTSHSTTMLVLRRVLGCGSVTRFASFAAVTTPGSSSPQTQILAAALVAGPHLAADTRAQCFAREPPMVPERERGQGTAPLAQIPFVAPGDELVAEQSESAVGGWQVVEVTKASPLRARPRCSLFTKCNGCQLQHISYLAQLQWKREQVKRALEEHGTSSCTVQPTVSSPRDYGYRSKLTPHFRPPFRRPEADASSAGAPENLIKAIGFLQVSQRDFFSEKCDEDASSISSEGDSTTLGPTTRSTAAPAINLERKFSATGTASHDSSTTRTAPDSSTDTTLAPIRKYQAKKSHRGPRPGVVDVPECPIAMPEINVALPKARESIRAESAKWKHDGTLFLRALTSCDGSVRVVSDTRAEGEECVLGNTFRFRAGDFFQNNPFILPALVEYVIQEAKHDNMSFLVDAYCGVGLFSVCASGSFKQCFGVEISAPAIEFAKHNAKRNGKQNCHFVSADAHHIFADISQRGVSPEHTAVIVDPPRSGCSQDFLKQLVEFGPSRIVYVSCNPATQARDVAWLAQTGLRLEKVTPFDLFPQTKHIESVATLVRV